MEAGKLPVKLHPPNCTSFNVAEREPISFGREPLKRELLSKYIFFKNQSSIDENKIQQLSSGEKSTTSSVQVVEKPSLKRKAPQVVKPKVRLDENGDIIVDKSSLYVQEENAR